VKNDCDFLHFLRKAPKKRTLFLTCHAFCTKKKKKIIKNIEKPIEKSQKMM